MTAPHVDDERELLRLMQLLLDSAHRDGVSTLQHYIHEDYLLTYSLYEQDKHGYLNKEQVIAKWGSQSPDDSGTATVSEQRVLLSGDTAIVFSLITDTFQEETGEQTIRTWVSDTWVKRDAGWRWFASHESFLK